MNRAGVDARLWRSVVALAILGCLALLPACSDDEATPDAAGPSGSPEPTAEATVASNPTPSLTPVPTRISVSIDQNPTPPPGEPRVIEITGHHDQPLTPEHLAGWGDLVIVGVVREHLPSGWSTPDGSRPDEILGRTSYTIFTPVVIDLEEPPLMDRTDSSAEITSIVTFIEGGTIDEVTITHTGSFYDLPVGARVVVSALPTSDSTVASIYGDVFSHMLPEGHDIGWLPQLRFILSGGSASTDGQRFPEAEFFARLETAIATREMR